MSQPKNHHYLPVFYLSRWCGGDGRVFRYYRPHDKVVCSSVTPDNTGYERFLYSFDGVADHRRQMLETEFFTPAVDTPAARALAVLLDGAGEVSSTKSDWARFLMALRLRNPASLEEVEQLSLGVIHNLTSSPTDPEYLAVKQAGDPDTLLQWMEVHTPHVLRNAGKIFLPGLIDHEGIGGHLVSMKWGTIDLRRADRSLLVGDRPLLIVNGLKDKNCVVLLPISPTRLFVATNDERQIQKLLKRGDRYLAGVVNDEIVRRATRHVYGSGPGHLNFVQSRLVNRTSSRL